MTTDNAGSSDAGDDQRPRSARKEQPLSEVVAAAHRSQMQATKIHVPSWYSQVQAARLNLGVKAAVSPDILRVYSAAERLNKMFAVPIRPDVLRVYQAPAFEITKKLNNLVRNLVQPSLVRMASMARRVLPDNWGDAWPDDWDEFRRILAHEGIPLLWVPGPKIVEAIFDAGSASERRRVISRRWKGIVTDCETALETVAHRHLADESSFALSCVDALRDGHHGPAQALAANLLDSVMRKFFSKDLRIKLTGNKFKQNGVDFGFDDYRLRAALTFAPVWCAHAQYWPDKGDPIPPSFGRHPSAHGVSRRQYKRVNAVIALMLVTSVIKFFDEELQHRDAN